MSRPFVIIYNALWLLSRPFLRRSPRLAKGWEQRTLHTAPRGPFDLWIQAASGGESQLVNMVLDKLAEQIPTGQYLRILVTSTTPQGIESLERSCQERSADKIKLAISSFPLDAPSLMDEAFARFLPKLAILTETELWPGFLLCAQKRDIPVMVINGRISSGSYRFYRRFFSFFQGIGPKKILAISDENAKRFASLFGKEQVEIVANIKFDKIPASARNKRTIEKFLPTTSSFVVFGSIRQLEEKQILCCIRQLLGQHPAVVIGVFPKHIERAEKIAQQTAALGICCCLRSKLTDTAALPGTVIIWDIFGELPDAYQQAEAAFVGGSLCNKGGHNLLEPLVTGIRPLTGPDWKDFSWLGREIITTGLTEEIANWQELATALHKRLVDKEDKDEVVRRAQQYLEKRQGGTAVTCSRILNYLDKIS